ncbi:hypothetical protein GCM10010129_06450 [Streptomyces fumigatiscleroticus]|nr:hypothetical protein GCM10010129_06450 [Streptomyces fumigatiscleroticus]
MALVAAALTGCTDEGGGSTPSGPAASRAASAATSLSSEAAEALASAKAEAKRRLDQIQNGVDVKDDVRLGEPVTAVDGRTRVPVTVHNTTDAQKSFAVQVDFTDQGGNLLDTVVVTMDDIPAGATAKADARSTHDLAGEVHTTVYRAVRY